MRIKEIIGEGLIKAPPRMLHDVMQIVARDLLWMLRDKTAKAKYPTHYRTIMATAKKYNVSLPKAKFSIPSSKMKIFDGPLEIDDLPKQYHHLKPDQTMIKILLDYGRLPPGDAVAQYLNYSVVIFMLRIPGVAQFPSHREPDEVGYMLRLIRNIMRHELQHLVQFVLLKPKDRRQTDRLPDYQTHGDDYYASQVERDPQIEDAVHEFVEYWSMLNQPGVLDKPSLSKAIKQYVGAIPSQMFNGFSAAPVFKALKRKDPEAYRAAIKKFVVALDAALLNASRT